MAQRACSKSRKVHCILTNKEIKKKQIVILGSTGSIGTQALQVVEEHPELYEVYALTANNKVDLLIAQARKFQPEAVVIANEEKYGRLKEALSDLPIKVYAGAEAVCQIVESGPVDIVLTAMVGYAGLKPTINAIRARKAIALANKETLVVAGELINELAQQYRTPILPVDSEHSAVFQCLAGEVGNPIEKVILTASGGPFRGRKREELEHIQVEDALKHPNWAMGRKITIVKQSAQTILVDVENVEEKDFTDLVVEYTGKVADGYVAGLSSMSTDAVTVKAPTSIIDKIKKVAVRCSLDGTNTNISKKCPVILYDKNDKEIKSDEIELSDKKIRVNVNVLRAKQVPISTINKDELGKPADGYVVDDVILSSDSITVYGSEESLDSIESLDIQDDIDVSDAKGDVTQNIDVTIYHLLS